MIDRSILRPDCRTKGGVILQVGIIITSLPETDQSVLQDAERRVCTRADEKDDHDDAEIRSALPDVSLLTELVIWHAVALVLRWRPRELTSGRLSRFPIQWSERMWDMCWYRCYCFLPLSQHTRLVLCNSTVEFHQPWNHHASALIIAVNLIPLFWVQARVQSRPASCQPQTLHLHTIWCTWRIITQVAKKVITTFSLYSLHIPQHSHSQQHLNWCFLNSLWNRRGWTSSPVVYVCGLTFLQFPSHCHVLLDAQ